ncbi:MAG TPA: hydroxymethylglutaryl-CoA lyase, partial [Caulobacteraceae bacterium]|nr:hydroxymethylglutaryl-CoA lyase [Caulobacteraceae bacterium]
MSTADKVAFIDLLSSAGFPQINAVSFVSPKAMPHMADAAEIMSAIHRRAGVVYDATTPNRLGVQRALESGVPVVSIFVSASLSDVRPGATQDDALVAATDAITQARES